jgi:hypothetical protein
LKRSCLDQVKFMDNLFEQDRLGARLNTFGEAAKRSSRKPSGCLERRSFGQFDRGDTTRITGLPDRSCAASCPT